VARKLENTMLHANQSKLKLTALAFSVLMTLAVNGSLLMGFDAIAQTSQAQVTLPTITIYARQA
jgi:hypothetical protein